MMDVNGHYEQRMQHYQSLLREAEEHRVAREAGSRYQKTPGIHSLIVAAIRAWLSRLTAPEISRNETLIHSTRDGG